MGESRTGAHRQAEGLTREQRNRALEAEAQTRVEADKVQAINSFLRNDLLSQAEPKKNAVEDRVTLLEVLDRAAERVGERFAGRPDLEIALRKTIGQTYHDLASWDKSEQQFQAILDLASQKKADPFDEYWAMSNFAHIQMHQGRTDEKVLSLFRTAITGLTRVLGPDDVTTLNAQNELALAYQDAGRNAEAIQLFEATLKRCESKLGPDDAGTITTRHNLALAMYAVGRTAEAIPIFQSTLGQSESKFGPTSPTTLSVRHNLATVYMSSGRLNEAIPIFESTLKERERRLGVDEHDTVETRHQLGLAYMTSGRLNEAVALLQEVLEQRDRKLGKDNPATIVTAHNLAHAMSGLRNVKAEPLFLRALAYYQKTEGPDGPLTLDLTRDLVMMYVGMRRLAEAEPLAAELLARRKPQDAGKDPILANGLPILAQSLLKQKKWPEAETILRELLPFREKTQPDLWSTFSARSMLGDALLGQKKYAEAEPLLVEGYEGMKEREASMPVNAKTRLIEALDRLVHLYEAVDNKEMAEKWRRELEDRKARLQPK